MVGVSLVAVEVEMVQLVALGVALVSLLVVVVAYSEHEVRYESNVVSVSSSSKLS